MDEVVKNSIKLTESKRKDPSKLPWKPDQPFQQPQYSHQGGKWVPHDKDKNPESSLNCRGLSLWSWNIDFMLPFPDERMQSAINHLRSLIEVQKRARPDMAFVIFLAECVETDLRLIAADLWVQENFKLTDVTTEFWTSGHYGTTTLIDRRLEIADCFRVHYSKTRMERDGLFVDVRMSERREQVLRLCNTHLESLALEPPYRPPQLEICSQYMHAPGVQGAILAGDLNAIQPFDRTLHTTNQLRDAYLELGGSEDDAGAGHTWGQQAATYQRERFGTSRMDKVYFCGGVQLTSFERFGADVELEDPSQRKELVALGFDKPWITDHLGVHACFEWAPNSRI